MKTKKIYVLVLLLIVPLINNAQDDYSENEKQFDLTELSKAESKWHNPSLYSVDENKVFEAIPIIENNFWNFDRHNQNLALKVLYRLNSENTSSFAYMLLDTLDANPRGGQAFSPIALHSKVNITEVLCQMGDFSTTEYVFDLLDISRGQEEYSTNHILYLIIKNYPPQEERARNELEYSVLNSSDVLVTLMMLEDVYGAEMIPFFIKVFKESPESATRIIILNNYFEKYHNEIDLQGILREQLYADTTSSVRLRIAKVLLFGVGGTRNYNFVKNYIPNENDLTIKTLLEYKIESYHPDPFDSTTNTETMLDTLISYTNQCYNFEWIDNAGIYNSLSKKIENAKKDLVKGKLNSTKNKIEAFQNEVAAQHEKHITNDGYKFLYYFSDYIIGRLYENGE
ncbi:MAG: hypothetical protein PF445_02580 [Melioribacteraceae bacterium]|jgi:hypothetical protein|nr:hypothetical protein [Melioribacteraceae bacterium]